MKVKYWCMLDDDDNYVDILSCEQRVSLSEDSAE
jgi:hypothetical protein